MAHFAELDNTNTVTRVIVVHNNELLDEILQNPGLGNRNLWACLTISTWLNNFEE
jgi:hypothetical protein